MPIHLTSDTIRPGEPIPRRYTGEGEDLSPPLHWANLPAGTCELALIVEDPDAPTPRPFVHWLPYGIPPARDGLPEGLGKPQAEVESGRARLRQGKNSFGELGY